MQHILSLLRRAVDEYCMIEEGDRIAVGCSGGKDSTLMLLALSKLSDFYPKKFSVIGIAIDVGLGMDYSPLEDLCKKENIEFIIKKTEIAKIIFDVRKESNPCSLCSRMRRGCLNNAAASEGANKVALGHHKDDVIETFFLSLIHESRLSTFQPVTYLSRKDIEVIRPMIFIPEKDIRKAVKRLSLPVLFNPCPEDGKTERESMKQLLFDLEGRYRGVKNSIFSAIENSELAGWQRAEEDRKKDN